MADVFISYSRKDRGFVRQLHDALAKLNRDTWVDWEDIPPTAKWLAEIYEGIEKADTVVFVISPDSVASETCRKEIAHALKHNKRIVPLVRREVDAKDVPPPLGHFQWIFFRDSDDFEGKFRELINALDIDLDWVRAHTRLPVRAIEWDKKKRDASLMMRGRELRDAEEWQAKAATGKEPRPTELQGEYVLASRRAETRRQTVVLAGVTFGLIVAIVLSIFAIYQANVATIAQATTVAEAKVRATAEANAVTEAKVRATAEVQALTERNIAQSRELSVAANSNLNIDPELSILLAIEANHASHTYESEDALRKAIGASLTRLALRGHTNFVISAVFSPDGKQIVTASYDNTARVWDAASGRGLVVLRGHMDRVFGAAFSPDSKRIVTASWDRTARVWDAASGRELTVLRGHTSNVISAEFSPDSKRVITAIGDNTARVWDAASGRELGVLRGHTSSVLSAVFSPDGKQVVTVSNDGTARVYLVRIEDLTLARTRVTSDLTCEEREKYLHEPPCPTPTPAPTPKP